ncbi:hypothetical protein Phi4:1_gp145 [Cellulophaga phage phi4:1]|uniref:Uncharacterized protein n=5 Tax=Lightbulbvirus TaxID=1918522 RepID=A0A0S2MWQ2_9CAUD|nr:hypothetical protein Phi4:1_gp145 [Cellulophaga phage phi4:1]YP_008241644.1 hypothetical protein Phi17:2_gp149 [Cellulophaga phage phi17:2]ALO80154.1 hypothetical protein Phi4113_145 [Cellulophaga phage phi4:1_13]ALO80351.1 hypothetical protein Phi4118_145 [Cellulophaga phage phi4:1_18]ALO80552.1 hypothetical protein Phi17218_149 [Cellulophaga phage phi17:2_18]AGO47682.1 hypothetical protein Phi17:2_gp149 [Cellulophaga phage phi17:2]AGO49558.1 hypothetical protein Phi4:1_gp145 [Cellulophag
MKTLVSIITGRKDYPIFTGNSNNEAILKYLSVTEAIEAKLDEDIIITDSDEFKIINVEEVVL